MASTTDPHDGSAVDGTDLEWDVQADEEAADLAARPRLPRGRILGWWAVGAVFFVIAASFATWRIMSVANEQVTATVVGFKVVDERTTTISFDVTKPPEVTVVCTVHAQNIKKALVGSAQVTVPPSTERTTNHQVAIKTTTGAVAALVQDCMRQ